MKIYQVFTDEANHTDKNCFTICGTTAFSSDAAVQMNDYVEQIRAKHGFQPEDKLKSSSSSKPKGMSPETHTKIKNDILDIATDLDIIFFAYAKFNPTGARNDPHRNQKFGHNTLFSAVNKFLKKMDARGFAFIDRIENAGFDYISEKFSRGNLFDEEWVKLECFLGFAQTCEGASHLASVNDIFTGSFRYIVNGETELAKNTLKEKMKQILHRGDDGTFREHGFFLRPINRSRLGEAERAEYEVLRSFLNA